MRPASLESSGVTDPSYSFETASSSTATVFAVEFFGDLDVYLWSFMVVVRTGQFVVSELKSGGPLHGSEQGARMREEGNMFSSAV